MATTGERLKMLREQRGESQADIAKLIGVGRTTYLKYESNENKPTRKLKELSDLFNVSSDYIMCLTDNPRKTGYVREVLDDTSSSITTMPLTADEVELVNCYRLASDDDKAIAKLALLKYMKVGKKKPQRKLINLNQEEETA
jgi:transcriptional regulator with XRE-family HTH domain